MAIEVTPSGQSCGASVRGVDLTKPLDPETVVEVRSAWLEHHVLAFPDQPMSDDDLERFTLYFGPFGDDPFIAPIPGRDHVIAVKREADETTPIFAESWHSDWSFQAKPPQGTCLFGITIPSEGGDTLYANQTAAAESLPEDLRARLEGKKAIHSAGVAYSPAGINGEADQAAGRSMDIRPDESAGATQLHPILTRHPETGRPTIHGAFGYIVGIDGMEPDEARDLLLELYRWQTRDEVVYRHVWAKDMLVMWDNRCVLHRATGGFEGQARLLHRTTIGQA
jgi:taurine dioxygenase